MSLGITSNDVHERIESLERELRLLRAELSPLGPARSTSRMPRARRAMLILTPSRCLPACP